MTTPKACHITLLALLAAVALTACDKAPSGVVKESKMAPLIADLAIAEAYADNHNDQYVNDSARIALKQAVFEKHNITQQQYDKSLDWYAQNMETYIKVCDKAIQILQKQRQDIDPNATPPASTHTAENPAPHQTYTAQGDTANVWNLPKSFLITQGLQNGQINFKLTPDPQHRTGDKYTLQLYQINAAAHLSVTLAADYSDQTTSITQQHINSSGWNTVTLQTDTTRTLTRVYGSINYHLRQRSVCLIDSITLLRTHLDKATYPNIGTQKIIIRNNNTQEPQVHTAPVNETPRTLRNQTPQPIQTYKPKPGVNKSSHQPHIQQSPNAKHLPK